MTQLSVMYRGALETCNYACSYCPFAKIAETADKKKADMAGLAQFVDWVKQQSTLRLKLLFTPWGEALVFKRYQDALIELSHLNHVEQIIFQTNLSCKLDFLQHANFSKLSLWCTYHPTEVTLEKFISQIHWLHHNNISHSVGIVGKPSFFENIEQLRHALPSTTYLWINAYRKGSQCYPYSPEQLTFLEAIDPHFRLNTQNYSSKGRACFAGENSITVDEFGDIRRCHFIAKVIGNIHHTNWQHALVERTCNRPTCECHIGYVHLKHLHVDRVYGSQHLARIPLIQPHISIQHPE